MRKTLAVMTTGLALGIMLTGCAENHGELGNKNIMTKSVKYDSSGNLIIDKRFANDQMNDRNRMNGRRLNNNNLIGSHKNYRMEMSEEIAQALTGMNSIKSSYVMLTDDNAYVAVSLDESPPQGKMASRSNNAYKGREGVEMSKRLHSMATGSDMLTEQVKADVADEVRRFRPRIKHVYVSANPDFVGRMSAYMGDVAAGHPIQGFMAEFNALVERVFPVQAADYSAQSIGKKHQTYIFD
jgi:YhcN/YlaJ family sporulation lipoprotein